MSRTKSVNRGKNFVDYVNGVSGRLKYIDAGHDAIEKKLKRIQKDGADLLNASFDDAFGLENKKSSK